VQVRPLNQSNRKWAMGLIKDVWISTKIVSKGKVHDTNELPGIIALHKNHRIGLLIYNIIGVECEIVSLNSLKENIGIGTALLKEIERLSILKGYKRLWNITTNDNIDALRFYQKNGFKIVAIHLDALERSRRLKPEIPFLGSYDIEIRDEIELEKIL
jgi:DNA-3-methyladenine glycosylase I